MYLLAPIIGIVICLLNAFAISLARKNNLTPLPKIAVSIIGTMVIIGFLKSCFPWGVNILIVTSMILFSGIVLSYLLKPFIGEVVHQRMKEASYAMLFEIQYMYFWLLYCPGCIIPLLRHPISGLLLVCSALWQLVGAMIYSRNFLTNLNHKFLFVFYVIIFASPFFLLLKFGPAFQTLYTASPIEMDYR